MTAVLEGGCECGAVRYRMLGPPIFVNCCHCRQCQRIGGSAFALNAMIEKVRIELLAGAEALVREGGETRCGGCRVMLWAIHHMFGENILFLRVGTLDQGDKLAPTVHFFVRSKHPWVVIPDGVLAFETLPGEADPPLFGPEAEARMKAASGG